jgi:hypothetical protein
MLAISRFSLVELWIHYTLWERKNKNNVANSMSGLQELGRLLLQAKTPAISSDVVGKVGFPSHLYFHFDKGSAVQVDRNVLFGMVCGFGVFLEISAGKGGKQNDLAKEIKVLPVPLVRDVLLARLQGTYGEELENSIAKAGFSAKENVFISCWIRKETSLVSASPSVDGGEL